MRGGGAPAAPDDGSAAPCAPVELVDLVLRGGLVVDGSGHEPYIGDVAVLGETIHSVGASLPQVRGRREVDCRGKVVCPGWVDAHTHLDAQCSFDPSLEPLTSNGVTTVIMGNCGVGFAPVRKEDRRFLLEVCEGVEDIPLGAMEAGIEWGWETFREFVDFMSARRFGCDVATFVAHAPVRAWVLGRRANLSDRPGGPARDPVSAAEVAAMAAVVKDAVAAGAIGFSTSRTLLHRDKSGVLIPGTLAGADEMVALGRAVAEGGGGVLEMASDFMAEDDAPYTAHNLGARLSRFAREWLWMHRVSHEYKVPLCVCLGIPSQSTPGQNGFRYMLDQVAAARADGCEMHVQVFVRPQSILMCWDSRSHPFVECASFAELKRAALAAGAPLDTARLRNDRALRELMVAEAAALAAAAAEGHMGIALPQSTDEDAEIRYAGNLNGAVNGVGALAKMLLAGAAWTHLWDPSGDPGEQGSALRLAQRTGQHPFHIIYDWLCLREGRQTVAFYFMNYSKSSLDDTHEMLANDFCIPGLGDSGAHLGFLCDATSHTYLLTHWVRDKKHGPKLSLQRAVKMHTRDTARTFGLLDRGMLAPGLKADVNVIDLAALRIHEPHFVHDLPNGAARWTQRATGYVLTLCSGQLTHENDETTGLLPGRFVKNQGAFKATPRPSTLSVALTQLKWQAKALGVAALAKVLGASNLEAIGFYMQRNPRLPTTTASASASL